MQTIDLVANHQMALKSARRMIRCENTVFWASWSTRPILKGSIWTWWRENGKFHVEKSATIPAEPAPKEQLPPLLRGFGAVPPLISDIDLSLDDKFLYVACWGTGEMRQDDVTEPRKPKLTGSVRIGGIASHTPHPNGKAYGGGPQMVEISRDGKRVYWTNSLYSTWDNQFYPDGVPGAEVMAIANPAGGLELAKDYWVSFPDGYRAHQIRLDGGDCSTDSVGLPIGLSGSGIRWTVGGLWLAVIASGLYHGVNPGMGWPLAVSAGMMEKCPRALVAALSALAAGHLLAMLVVILPFSLLVSLIYWQRQIRIGVGLLVMGFRAFRLIHGAISARWRA